MNRASVHSIASCKCGGLRQPIPTDDPDVLAIVERMGGNPAYAWRCDSCERIWLGERAASNDLYGEEIEDTSLVHLTSPELFAVTVLQISRAYINKGIQAIFSRAIKRAVDEIRSE